MNAALSVAGLSVEFATTERTVRAVRDVSFEVARGETVAIVGESGSGKSVTALSIMRLVEHGGGRIVSGRLDFTRDDGTRVDLAQAGGATMRAIRGGEIAMIFQEPMTSLNPVFTVGEQIAEAIRLHQSKDYAAANAEALRVLEQVRMPVAAQVMTRYPHQLSGGMRQRVMIAMALSCSPDILIADEPTTALDVTIQAQILERMRELRASENAGVVLVTHDLGVVADIADRVLVMYAGRIVEQGTLDEIFYDPQHPYTWGLLGSIARVDRPRPERLPAIPGLPPSLANRPEGCHFRPRCPHEFGKCSEVPPLEARVDGSPAHLDRCWLTPEEKRERREVRPGEIGLEAKSTERGAA